MERFKYLIGVSLLSVASAGLFVACGGPEEPVGDTCVLDTECEPDEVCEGEVCVPTCTTDEDCILDGQVCEDRSNGEGRVCVPDQTTSCLDETDPNAFCTTDLGEDAICNDEGQCEAIGEPPVFVVQISDVTTAAAACDGGDPGSDLQGVELQDSEGNSLGWGSFVSEAIITEGNEETDLTILDGTPPALDENGCVDTFSGNVLALGCTGWVAVEFLSEAGEVVPLEEGQAIFVYEYGGICSTGTTDDSYSVFTCSDTAGIKGGDPDSCSNTLGTGSGIGSVAVEFGE